MNLNLRNMGLVDQYVQALFNKLPENAYYYDNSYDYPIHYYYQNIRHERPDLHCPIIFTFWTPEDEKIQVANQIMVRISQKKPVYLSRYVFDLLKSKLKYQGLDRIEISGDDIYRIF